MSLNLGNKKLTLSIVGAVTLLASGPLLLTSTANAFGRDLHHHAGHKGPGLHRHAAVPCGRCRRSFAGMDGLAPRYGFMGDDGGHTGWIWNGARWRACQPHWVGMAGYYGVPWAYNEFLDLTDECDNP